MIVSRWSRIIGIVWACLWMGCGPCQALDTRSSRGDLDTKALFDIELRRIAEKFRISSDTLKKVLLFETAGTLDPSIRNERSGAVGLIQFTEAVARELGTSLDALANMSAVEQLVYVEKYLDRTPLGKVPEPTVGDVYLAVLAPRYVLSEPETVIYARDTSGLPYLQNIEFDTNVDGKIIRQEVEEALVRFAQGNPPLQAVVGGTEGFYDLSVNGAQTGEAVYIYKHADGTQYIAEEDFEKLGISKTLSVTEINGARMVPLTESDGALLTVNEDESKAALSVPASWYASRNIDLSGRRDIETLKSENGTFINYRFDVDGNPSGDYSAFAGAALTNLSRFGLLYSSLGVGLNSDEEWRGSRGQTYFLRENYAKRTFLRIGDGLSGGGPGISVRQFAGISYGSNLSLDPTYNPFMSYDYSGEALLPTSVEFLRNGKYTGSRLDLKPGQFTIENLPVVNGSGDLTLVMTDSLGQKSEVTLPFLRSTQLYRQGVRTFDVSGGVGRRSAYEYELDSPFVSASQRWGMTDRVTLSTALNADLDAIRGGAGIATVAFDKFIIEPFFGLGISEDGLGYTVGSRITPLGSVLGASFGISGEFSSAAYRMDERWDDAPQRFSISGYLGRSIGELGQISAFGTYRDDWDGEYELVAGVSLSRQVLEGVSADATLSYMSDGISAMFGLQFDLADETSYVTSQVAAESGRLYAGGEFVRQRPVDNGVGYRVSAYRQEDADASEVYDVDGQITARTRYGEHSASTELRDGRLNLRARTAGSIGFSDGEKFVAPPIRGAVAIVDAGGLSELPVYRYNSPVGKTNRSGKLIVTDLASNSKVKMQIKAEDLPFEYNSEKTENEFFTRGSGFYRVGFGVTRQRPAVVILQDETGIEVESGAEVTLIGTDEKAYVGLNGEVFFEDLPFSSELKISAGSKMCRFVVSYVQSDDPQPRLGPYRCEVIRGDGTPQRSGDNSIY